MAYSTRLQLKTIFPSIDEFGLDNTAVTAFITRADNVINGKLSQLYTTPFSVTPPIVNDLSKNLALVYILQRHYTQQIPNESKWIETLREEVFDTLQELQEGVMTIVSSDGTILDQRTDRQRLLSTTIDYNPIFDMRDSVYQNVDPDRLDAEDAADT